ncbi:MAG TPA: response regulator [Terriglobia bacterium]|nr:response regulator [Terriglobia bacterium]
MKILIVDDEPEILTIVSKWLTRAGHQVLTTTDPQKVSEYIQATDFDVVLLDLIMPGSSGLNLIARIHEKKPKQAIIVMSVIEDTRVAVLAAQEGIEGYLTKPIDFDKLDELLRSIKR